MDSLHLCNSMEKQDFLIPYNSNHLCVQLIIGTPSALLLMVALGLEVVLYSQFKINIFFILLLISKSYLSL